MRLKTLTSYIFQHELSGTAVSGTVDLPFKPFKCHVVDVIQDLKSIADFDICGVKSTVGMHTFHLILDEGNSPTFLVRDRTDDDELYDCQYFESYIFTRGYDAYEHDKEYFIALVCMCQASKKLSARFKQLLSCFLSEALLLKERPFQNFWPYNSYYLLELIEQHKLTDFDFN